MIDEHVYSIFDSMKEEIKTLKNPIDDKIIELEKCLLKDGEQKILDTLYEKQEILEKCIDVLDL